MPNIPVKTIFFAIIALVIIILFKWSSGINDAGQRTVIQYPNGTLKVQFDPGWYWTWFGKETTYDDVITFDFDRTESEDATIDQDGAPVRYQDGGTGTIYGKARFRLPDDDTTMISAHKSFHNNRGLAYKLLKTVTEESLNLTAGLMTSEAAYAEKRGTFIQWSQDQIKNGKFQTRLEETTVVDEAGKSVTKKIPVIDFGKDGLAVHLDSDFKKYGITVDGYQIVDWNFESKTLNQISAKREATMAIITAIAQAEQAKQEAITAEEKGKASVMSAKYEKEVEKVKAVVEAEQKQEVAVIEAMQKVDVAEQEKLEAEQKKFAAVEYKLEQIARGEGDGEYKRLVMEADGALQQKLDAWVTVNGQYAEAIKSNKWVPEVQFNGTGIGGNGTGSAANDLINLLLTRTSTDLALDMKMKAGASSSQN